MHNQHITTLAKNYMMSLHGEFTAGNFPLGTSLRIKTPYDNFPREQGHIASYVQHPICLIHETCRSVSGGCAKFCDNLYLSQISNSF